MEISGKIIFVLPFIEGEGRNGKWRKQSYVLETADQYPRKVCFDLFNDRIEQFPLKVGDQVEVSFDIDSREYNGRWFTNIQAWKVVNKSQASPLPPPDVTEGLPPFPGETSPEDGSDLPF